MQVSAGPVAEGEEDEEAQLAAEADLCAPPTPAEMKLLKRMGGSWWDRFWVREIVACNPFSLLLSRLVVYVQRSTGCTLCRRYEQCAHWHISIRRHALG